MFNVQFGFGVSKTTPEFGSTLQQQENVGTIKSDPCNASQQFSSERSNNNGVGGSCLPLIHCNQGSPCMLTEEGVKESIRVLGSRAFEERVFFFPPSPPRNPTHTRQEEVGLLKHTATEGNLWRLGKAYL